MSQGSLLDKLEELGLVTIIRDGDSAIITKALDLERVKAILPYVLSLINKLHMDGYVHDDAFIGNYLVSRNGTLMLGDFSRAKRIKPNIFHFLSELW